MKKLFYLLLFIFTVALLYGFYLELTKKQNHKRVACQEKTTTFEKIYSNTPIKEAIERLKTDNYVIESRIEYSHYMPSHLITVLTIQKANTLLETVLKSHHTHTKEFSNPLLIDYYIYENDKEDKGKKNANAKEYAGYVVFEFKLDNQLLYKIQTDYMDTNANDLEERFKCVLDSFLSL
ncbi:MAG: hypothetical protein WCR15_05145 [Arcobacteraceae bacterium]